MDRVPITGTIYHLDYQIHNVAKSKRRQPLGCRLFYTFRYTLRKDGRWKTLLYVYTSIRSVFSSAWRAKSYEPLAHLLLPEPARHGT